MEKLAIGSDHAGFQAKEMLKKHLDTLGYAYEDMGCYSSERVDYPRYGEAVARAVAAGEYPRGILICGTGIGMSITANKFPGIRAALCHDLFTAQACREHNDANILVMGARVLSDEQICAICDCFLSGQFAGERHAQRLAQIADLEKRLHLR